MNRRHLLACVAGVAALALLAAPVHAADRRHRGHQEMVKRLQESGKTLEQAESAEGPEREQLMERHMQMMEEHLRMMEDMKAPEDMSMDEHMAWIRDHRRMMQDMLAQMRRDHEMIKARMHEGCGEMMHGEGKSGGDHAH